MELNWQIVFEGYPVNQELIWLNNCGVTPAGNHVVAAITHFINDYARNGILAETAAYGPIKVRIKEILAELIHCRSDEVSLVHNTAEGMNIVSRGLKLSPGDEIILLENEYPSNVYPWLHWKKRGIQLTTTPMGGSPQDFLETFKKRLNSRTRVVTLSAVHWCTGMPLPLAEIGDLCRQREIILVVDGAQGVGLVPLDCAAYGISFMAFSAWKWLMGPPGLGGFYVAREMLDRIDPVLIGTESVVDDHLYLPYKSELKPNADRFIFSTPSLQDWVYFQAALELLESIGFEQVQSRIHFLTAHLNAGLRRIGCRVTADGFGDRPTGITVFEKPGSSAQELVAALKAKGIIAVERLGKVRFSPHIYLSIDQLDRAVQVVSEG